MREPAWISREECVAIHEMMLAQYGGAGGVRDQGLLESALGKPRNLWAYEHSALSELAASYASGIIRNHPFIDGNKRTGFMLAVLFLETNGLNFHASEESVVKMTVGFAAGDLDEAAYAKWLKENCS